MSGSDFTIRWTQHARQRALERDVSEDLVKHVINNPKEVVYDSVRDNYKSYALVQHSRAHQMEYLMVVHTSKFNTEVSIISVMWTTKGGLRNNGFNIS